MCRGDEIVVTARGGRSILYIHGIVVGWTRSMLVLMHEEETMRKIVTIRIRDIMTIEFLSPAAVEEFVKGVRTGEEVGNDGKEEQLQEGSDKAG